MTLSAGVLAASLLLAQAGETTSRPLAWSIEPIKLTSLMLNLAPGWSGWGIEGGRRITSSLWFESFLERDVGHHRGIIEASEFEYITGYDYTAWLNTLRYFFSPQEGSFFADAGFAVQAAKVRFIRNGTFHSESAHTLSIAVLGGYEWLFKSGLIIKIRLGGAYNVLRSGSMDDQPNVKDWNSDPADHLTAVMVQPALYIGDVGIGMKF